VGSARRALTDCFGVTIEPETELMRGGLTRRNEMAIQEPTPNAALAGGSRGRGLRFALMLVQRFLAVRFVAWGQTRMAPLSVRV